MSCFDGTCSISFLTSFPSASLFEKVTVRKSYLKSY